MFKSLKNPDKSPRRHKQNCWNWYLRVAFWISAEILIYYTQWNLPPVVFYINGTKYHHYSTHRRLNRVIWVFWGPSVLLCPHIPNLQPHSASLWTVNDSTLSAPCWTHNSLTCGLLHIRFLCQTPSSQSQTLLTAMGNPCCKLKEVQRE